MTTGDLLYRDWSKHLMPLVEGFEIFKGKDCDKSWSGQYQQHKHHSMQLLKKKEFESEQEPSENISTQLVQRTYKFILLELKSHQDRKSANSDKLVCKEKVRIVRQFEFPLLEFKDGEVFPDSPNQLYISPDYTRLMWVI